MENYCPNCGKRFCPCCGKELMTLPWAPYYYPMYPQPYYGPSYLETPLYFGTRSEDCGTAIGGLDPSVRTY